MIQKKAICHMILLFALTCNIIVGQLPDYSTKLKFNHLQSDSLSYLNDSIFNSNKKFVIGKLYYSGGNKFVHPFFGDNSWVPAIVFSSNEIYKTDLAKYDLYIDYLVILQNFESFSYPVYLNKEVVREFTIYGHHFKYLDGFDVSATDKFDQGYYEEIYDGETKFFVHHVKLKNFDNADLSEAYTDRIYFILMKGGNYFRIIRQKSLIKVLNDHKKEIKAYMKKNNLRFSQDNYEVAGKVLSYYDTL